MQIKRWTFRSGSIRFQFFSFLAMLLLILLLLVFWCAVLIAADLWAVRQRRRRAGGAPCSGCPGCSGGEESIRKCEKRA